MTEAWRVFTWYLAGEQGDLKQKGLKIKDECPPYCLGLEKIECKDTAAEEVRKLFLEYFTYVFPSRTNVLKDQLTKFDQSDE